MKHRLTLLLFALFWGTNASAAIRPMTGGTLRLVLGDVEMATRQPRGIGARIRASLRECSLGDLLATPPQVDANKRRLLLRLDDGLVFHNGRPILAADVVRSLGEPVKHGGNPERFRLLVIEGAATRMAGGEAGLGLRATGPRSLQITLAFPLGAEALAILSHPGLPIRGVGGSPCGPFQSRQSNSAPRRAGGVIPFERHPAGRPFFDRVLLATQRPILETGATRADVRLAPAPDTPRELPLETRSLTFLQVNGSAALRAQIAAALDREAIVRYLVGGRARATPTFLPDAPRSPPASRAQAAMVLPEHPITLAFDGGDTIHRRIAERIQVRLREVGLEVVLSPLLTDAHEALLTGATELALVTLPGLPRDPAIGLASLVSTLLGPRPAFEVLEAAQRVEHEDRARSDDLKDLGDLEAELPIIILYTEDESVWESDDLQGAQPSGPLPFDPGALWRYDPQGVEPSP